MRLEDHIRKFLHLRHRLDEALSERKKHKLKSGFTTQAAGMRWTLTENAEPYLLFRAPSSGVVVAVPVKENYHAEEFDDGSLANYLESLGHNLSEVDILSKLDGLIEKTRLAKNAKGRYVLVP